MHFILNEMKRFYDYFQFYYKDSSILQINISQYSIIIVLFEINPNRVFAVELK
jgi:hypothetical protein